MQGCATLTPILYDPPSPYCGTSYASVKKSVFSWAWRRRMFARVSRMSVCEALRREKVTVIDAIIAREAIGPVTRYDKVRDREL